MLKDKGLIIGIIATIVLIAGGVFLMSRGSSGSSSSVGSKVSEEILVPKGDYITSGIENGNYLPASSSAKITLVEFGDYECPACGVYHPFVKQLLTEFAGKINFVFRNFPLSQHANAKVSAEAAEAAGLQGKYWQMHDKLFETQTAWSALSDPKGTFLGYAQILGFDEAKFMADLDSQTVKDKIQSDTNDGTLINLSATPTFYLNGVKIENLPSNYDEFKKLVNNAI